MKFLAGLSLCFFAVTVHAFVSNAPLHAYDFPRRLCNSLDTRAPVSSLANRGPKSRNRSSYHSRATVKCVGDTVWSKVRKEVDGLAVRCGTATAHVHSSASGLLVPAALAS